MQFSGIHWWENKNPSYRYSCFNKAKEEMIQDTKEYEAIIKHSNNKNK